MRVQRHRSSMRLFQVMERWHPSRSFTMYDYDPYVSSFKGTGMHGRYGMFQVEQISKA
jgi:hypothetical protein